MIENLADELGMESFAMQTLSEEESIDFPDPSFFLDAPEVVEACMSTEPLNLFTPPASRETSNKKLFEKPLSTLMTFDQKLLAD